MDDSYSAPVTAPDQAAESETSEETASVDEENAASNTALVSNKILSPEGEPLKEGDEIVVRIVKNYGNESEIEYAPHKEGESEEEGETETMPGEMRPGNEASELAALDEKGY